MATFNTINAAGIGGGGGSASYLVYTALLTQTGTNAPVASLRQDDIEGVWSRNAAGSYYYTKAGAFLANKIWIPYGLDGNSIGTYVEDSNNILVSLSRMSDDVLELITNENGVGNSDDWLSNTPIEFRVYP